MLEDRGTPQEESNIALYKSSPFYPHLTPVHFYLDNLTIPLAVRKNMILLYLGYSPMPARDNSHSFSLLLERYAREGTTGNIHSAVEKMLLSLGYCQALFKGQEQQQLVTISSLWEELGKALVLQGVTPLTVFPSTSMNRRRHPIVMAMNRHIDQVINTNKEIYSTAQEALNSTRESAWRWHHLGRWYDDSQVGVRESIATSLYINSLIYGSGFYGLSDLTISYREQTSYHEEGKALALELSSSLMKIDYPLVSTLLELSAQVENLHILEHHERITTERWREFSALRHGYNLEWALASFDWSGGIDSQVNRINYGHGAE